MYISKKLVAINKKLFDQYPIYFPLEDKLTIIIGHNGSGKTKLLESMRYYYTEQGENVVYFPYPRTLDVTYEEFKKVLEQTESLVVLNQLSERGYDLDFIKKWRLDQIDESVLEQEFKWSYSNYINSGTMQAINFLTQIMNAGPDVIVMIDFPEISMDNIKRRNFADDMLNLPNVKKLIMVTHCPEILGGHREYVWDVENLVDIQRGQ